MYTSRVISINPGEKTLGELHNPTVSKSRLAVGIGFIKACKRDDAVDAVPVKAGSARLDVIALVARLILAVVIVYYSLSIGNGLMEIAMIAGTLFLTLGIGCRFVALAEMILAFTAVVYMAATPMLPQSLLFAALAAVLSLPLVTHGAGMWSVDNVISRRLSQRKS